MLKTDAQVAKDCNLWKRGQRDFFFHPPPLDLAAKKITFFLSSPQHSSQFVEIFKSSEESVKNHLEVNLTTKDTGFSPGVPRP